jgi:polar amino acid transport system substrate-binding protein
MLYDGEAMMVRASDMAGIAPEAGVRGLAKRIVAVQQGATTALNLERFFGDCELDYELRYFATPNEALAGYASGQCNIYALDLIPLSGERLRLDVPDDHVILDETISKEAMGPVVSARDTDWLRAVTWILRSLIEAEELGLNSSNSRHLSQPLASHLQAFLHPSKEKLARLGLQESFPLKILQHVGNYAEIFNNNRGCASPLNMPRHHNMLATHGGLMISPSFQ